MNIIDLQKIFKETWGYIGSPFPTFIIKGIPKVVSPSYTKFTAAVKNEMSSLSVPLYAKNSNNREVFMPTWLSETERTTTGYMVPNCVMSLANKKEIVTTKMVNRDGTVKEEISLGEWQINIKGVIVSSNSSYPEAEVQMMVEWYKKRVSLNIQNARTAMCMTGDEKVVITDLKLPEIKGFENTQPYEISLISDIEFDLYEEKPDYGVASF